MEVVELTKPAAKSFMALKLKAKEATKQEDSHQYRSPTNCVCRGGLAEHAISVIEQIDKKMTDKAQQNRQLKQQQAEERRYLAF